MKGLIASDAEVSEQVAVFCACVRTERSAAKELVEAFPKPHVRCPDCGLALYRCCHCGTFTSTTMQKPSPFDELLMALGECCDKCGHVSF